MKYTIFSSTTGMIISTVICDSNSIEIQLQNDESYIEGNSNDITQYIPDLLNPAITDKPKSQITLDKTTVKAGNGDIITVSNIPPETTIQIKNEDTYKLSLLETQTDTISFDEIGEYTLIFSVFPYLDLETKINAN